MFLLQGSNNFTPLFFACQYGHILVAEVLLDNGANVSGPCEVFTIFTI